MRTLILLAKAPDLDLPERVARGEIPRLEYLQLQRARGAELVDFHDVARARHPAVRLAARRGPRWGLAVLGWQRRRAFDHIYCTGEDVGIPLAMMMRAAGDLGRLTVVIHNGGTPKRRVLLRGLGHAVWRHVICLSDTQQRVLCDGIGLPRFKVHRLDQWLDTRFFDPARARPVDDADAYALSVGRESRDYPTLERAAATLPYRFRVIASGWSPQAGFDTASNLRGGANIVVERGGLSYAELRDRHAGARLAIAPIARVTYAAGVTAICEAMAMGKPVIATRSPGVEDYIDEGVTGRLVPVGDDVALARAVRELWQDDAARAAMGRAARRFAEQRLSMDRYVERVAGLLGVDVPRSAEGRAP
jgi:glycosyltransferase involved in cell wall biosynthesis